MLRIGVTGGIGSGKSIICRVLSELGYPVFHSDNVAKALLNNDLNVREEISDLVGNYIYTNTEIDKKRLAEIIFKDETAREKINSIIHPRVRQKFEEFAKACRSELVFNEAAILFETDSYKNFDATILVTAPEELRIERVMKRDGVSREQVLDRIKSQWKDEKKAELADYILVNDEKKPLLGQIEEILADLVSRPQ